MQSPEECLPAAAAIEREIAVLYRSEGPGVLRYGAALAGNPETAKDAMQEAFFRFFLARSAGQEFQSPKAWLFRVVRNYILDQKRSHSRHEVGIESALHLAGPAEEPAAGFTRSDLLRRAAQSGLSAREAECLRLRTEGLRYEEIASVLGLRCGTVGALLARAHEKIRQAPDAGVRKNSGFPFPAAERRYAS